jgi:hypothetical protein
MSNAHADWFQALWTDREERAYPALFGKMPDSAYTSSPVIYEHFGKEPHPGWFNHTVYACPPNDKHKGWLYVTSGLSNPWNLRQPGRDPTGFSGIGCELVMETTNEVDWAVPLLHNLMSYLLLVAVGEFEGGELLEYGQHMPLNASITPHFESELRWLLVEPPRHFPASFELAAGRVDLFHLIGLTHAEVEFLNQTSSEMMIALLQREGIYPFSDAERKSCR